MDGNVFWFDNDNACGRCLVLAFSGNFKKLSRGIFRDVPCCWLVQEGSDFVPDSAVHVEILACHGAGQMGRDCPLKRILILTSRWDTFRLECCQWYLYTEELMYLIYLIDGGFCLRILSSHYYSIIFFADDSQSDASAANWNAFRAV